MLSTDGSWLAVSLTWRLKSARTRCTVSEPIAIAKTHRITNVSRAETPARRTRIGSRSKLAEMGALTRRGRMRILGAENVAGSPDRVQQSRLILGLELAAQIGDEYLDGVRGGEGVIAPDLVEQSLTGDDDAL